MMLDKWRFRKELEKENFFEEVIFEDEASKKAVEQWLLDLKKKYGFCFSGFKQLFDAWGWYIFPTTIKKDEISEDYAKLVVTDQCGIDFYLTIKRKPDQNTEFIITKEEENEQFKKMWTFKIVRSFKVELKSIEEHDEERITKLYTDFSKKLTKISVQNRDKSRKISATFEKNSIENAEEMLEVFKNMKFDYCIDIRNAPEVKGVFKDFRDIFLEGFIKDNKCSEMIREAGRIRRYMYTERVKGTNDFRMCAILKGKI